MCRLTAWSVTLVQDMSTHTVLPGTLFFGRFWCLLQMLQIIPRKQDTIHVLKKTQVIFVFVV